MATVGEHKCASVEESFSPSSRFHPWLAGSVDHGTAHMLAFSNSHTQRCTLSARGLNSLSPLALKKKKKKRPISDLFYLEHGRHW